MKQEKRTRIITLSDGSIAGVGRLKRQYLVIVSLLVACFLVVGIFLFYNPQSPASYEWNIEVDDTFDYDVQTWGSTAAGLIDSDEVDLILSLNSTRITITINELPSLEDITNSASFASAIVKSLKISCSFDNDTNLPTEINEYLTTTVSGCILPTGGWATIDNYYPDSTPSFAPGEEAYASKLYEDHFFFEWKWYGNYDDRGGWSGEISLIDGIPTSITWHYYHLQTIYIELTLSQ